MNLVYRGILFLIAVLLMSCTQEISQVANSEVPADSEDKSNNLVQLVEVTLPETQTYHGSAMKGPLDGSIISVYDVDAFGFKTGAAMASTTSVNGTWTITVSNPDNKLLLVEADGGTYIDESDTEADISKKRKLTLQSGEVLSSFLIPGQNTADINFFTHTLTKNFQKETLNAGDSIQAFNITWSRAYNALGFDPFSTLATNPISPASDATSAQLAYAITIGGAAQAINAATLASGQTAMNYTLIDAVSSDLADCNIDGIINGVNMSDTLGIPQSLFDSLDLNTEIARFRNNNYALYANAVLPQIDSTELCSGTPNRTMALPSILTNLSVDAGAISPVFTKGIKSYSIKVPYQIDKLKVTPTADTVDSSITVNGISVVSGQASADINLSVGSNSLPVIVQASDGVQFQTNTIDVTRNDPPVFTTTTTSFSISENTSAITTITATDSDADAITFSISPSSEDESWFSIDPNTGVLSFISNRDFEAPDDATLDNIYIVDIVASDSLNNSLANLSLEITVNDVNEAPIANGDTIYTITNQPITLFNAFNNDSDPEGNILSINTFDTATVNGGSVTNPTGGDFFIIPAAGYVGSDSFTYSIKDTANNLSNTTTVTVVTSADTDGDGISDDEETNVYGSSNASLDSDGDGFTDYHEHIALNTTTALMDPNEFPSGTTFSATETIIDSQIYTLQGSPYWFQNSLVVDGGTLTIEPGVVLKFSTAADSRIEIINGGTLVSQNGNYKSYFTSVEDDTYQGDTNVDGYNTTVSAGVWLGVLATTTSILDLDNLEIHHATNAIDAQAATVTLHNINIVNNSGIGLNLSNNTVSYLMNLLLSGSDASMKIDSTITPLSFSSVDYNGGHLWLRDRTDIPALMSSFAGTNVHAALKLTAALPTGTHTMNPDPLGTTTSVWYITSDANLNGISVPVGSTLDIADGTIIKGSDIGTDIDVEGTLNLNGAGTGIKITSYHDDLIGGDTDGIVQAPTDQDWAGINYRTGSTGSVTNTELWYAHKAMDIENTLPTIDGLTIKDVGNVGFEMYTTGSSGSIGSTPVIKNVTIDITDSEAVHIRSTSDVGNSAVFENLTISNPGLSAIKIENTGTGSVTPSFNINAGTTVVNGIGGFPAVIASGTNISASFDGAQINSGDFNVVAENGAGVSIVNSTLDGGIKAAVFIDDTSTITGTTGNTISNTPSPFWFRNHTDFATASTVFTYAGGAGLLNKYIGLEGSLASGTHSMSPDPLAATSVWYIATSLSIPSGATLDIGSQTIVKMGMTTAIDVSGTLNINGASANDVIITSFLDDSFAGDSNNDGASSGTANDFIGVNYNFGSSGAMTYTQIYNATDAVFITDSAPTIDVLTAAFVDKGIRFEFTDPNDVAVTAATTYKNISVSNANYGLYMINNKTSATSLSMAFENFNANTTYNAIRWVSPLGNDTPTFTINAGTMNLTSTTSSLATVEIYGYNTNPTIDGATIVGGVSGFYAYSGANGTVLNTTISGSASEAIFVKHSGTVTTFDNVTTTGSPYSIYANEGGVGIFTNSTFDGATIAAIYATNNSHPNFGAGNTIQNTPIPFIANGQNFTDPGGGFATATYVSVTDKNVTFSGTISTPLTVVATPLGGGSNNMIDSNTTFAAPITLEIGAYLLVTTGNTLTISPSQMTVIKSAANLTTAAGGRIDISDGNIIKLIGGYMGMSGELNVLGTNTSPVVFTSFYDDSYGGDTNGDGSATSPAIGDWTGISCSGVCNIDNAIVRFGGANTITGGSGGNFTLTNSVIESNSGLSMSPSATMNILNNIFANNSGSAIKFTSATATTNVLHNFFRNNSGTQGGAIQLATASTTQLNITNNLFVENSASVSGGAINVDASSSALVQHNTFYSNATSVANMAGGIHSLSTTGSLTDLSHNIFWNNTDGSGVDDYVVTDGTHDYNLTEEAVLTGTGNFTGSDPLFVQGWYISSLANEAIDSPAIDAGNLPLSGNYPNLELLTTPSATTDGLVDGGVKVDLGFHHDGGPTVVNATNSLVTFNEGNITTQTNSDTIIIEPRDASNNLIGSTLDIQLSSSGNFTIDKVIDRGTGIYEVTVTALAANATNDTVTVTVNDVTLVTVPMYTW